MSILNRVWPWSANRHLRSTLEYYRDRYFATLEHLQQQRAETERERKLKEIHFADAEKERRVRSRAASIASRAGHAKRKALRDQTTAKLAACQP